ncbi:MAG: endo-1,4-beta-xylanase [Spirochaetales bacterium]|nr:endo-1,4-beta-xylanase [Spirochaetales bacterium]
MRRLAVSVLIVSALLFAVSCATSAGSGNSRTTDPIPEQKPVEQPAEKGVSTVEDTDTLVMPEVIMEDTSSLSLYKAYEDRGIEIGTCTLPTDLEDEWVRDKIVTQFSSFCPFEGFKASQLLDKELSIRSGKLTVVFDEATRSAMQWARDNGKKIHGHTLIWFKSNPEWMFRENFQDDSPYVTREIMIQRLEDYIKGVFEGIEANGWSDLIYAFDILNEYLYTDGSKVNQGPWTDIIGEDAIWFAFKFARQYAPSGIKLIYNESYCEISASKRDAVIALLKTLVDENGNPLVDGIGLQCRMALRNKIDAICSNIEYIAQNIGDLELQLTEIDCTISTKPQVFADNLKKQGTYLCTLMDKVIELKDKGYNVTAVQFSGFRDDLDPLNAVSSSPALYDVKGREKYSYFGVLRMREYSGF